MKRLQNLLSLVAINLFVLVGCADTALAQNTTVTASPLNLTFSGQAGAASSIASQPISLSTTGGSVSFGASITATTDWLSIDQLLGVAPTTINASVKNSANSLPAGTYPATITITTSSSQTITISATLTLSGTGGGSSVLSASPNPAVFNLSPGAAAASQSVTVSSTGPATTISVAVSTSSGGGWLSVSPTTANISPGAPVSLNVTANPAGLASGTYTGTITVTPGAGSALNIGVTLNLGVSSGNSNLTASPNPINITVPAGSTSSVLQALTVSTAITGGISFTASASTLTGGSWLSVSPTSTQTASPGSPVTLNVTVNPTNLAANTYTGNITLTQAGGANPLSIPVNLTVTGLPALTVSPTMFSFAYQTGTAFPAAQTLTIGASGQLSFSIAATTQTGGNWLVVSPQNGGVTSGGVPANVTVSVNPAGLPTGTYTGQISVLSNGASNSPITVPVTLIVSNQPILTFGNSGTTLTYQVGNSMLPSAQVQLTSSGNPLSFTVTTTPVTGGNFLNVSPASGTTPQSLTFTLNPAILAGLGAGTYSETVTVTAPGAGNSPQTYTVTLVVSNSTLLTATQNALSFNYQIGQTQPQIQTLGIGSTGAPLNYAVTFASNNCGNFLSASPANGTTMAGSVAVAVNTTGLAAGTCTGVVTISSPGAGNSLNIPVSLFVSNAPLLNVSPSAINVITQVGTNAANQTIALTSTDPTAPLNFTVSTTAISGGNWLLVGPTSGATPANLNLGFTTSGLPVGTYNATITVASTGPANAPVVIPVTLVIAPSATVSSTPSSLTFNQAFAGPAPASQTLQLNSTTPGLNFTVSATALNGGSWLTVTPSAGITPGSVTVSANGSALAQGMYSGVVTFVVSGAANTPLNVPVTLIVGPAQSLAVSTNALAFTFQAGSLTTPAAQNVQVTSTGGNVPFTATIASGANFLTVTPASGMTPAPLAIGLSQSGVAALAPGTYTGAVMVSSPNLASQTVNVTLTVTAAAPPSVTTVVNAASGQPGPVSPGEIVSIFGANIGPATPAGLQLTPQGLVSTNLGNTVVTFDGIAAPLIFVSSGQINAIVPYEIAGRVTTNVVVQRNGQSSTTLQLRVADTAPAIFSLSQGGNGQGAILNFNSTVNGAANPAAKGSVIVIYATGEGALRPQPPTGSVTSSTGPTFPTPINNVVVKIGGQTATLQYFGEAPGLVSGVLQVNAVVPQNIGSGPQTVELTVGNAGNIQQTITVAIQ